MLEIGTMTKEIERLQADSEWQKKEIERLKVGGRVLRVACNSRPCGPDHGCHHDVHAQKTDRALEDFSTQLQEAHSAY